MLGSPKRDPVRFGFLKTQEPRVKFRVGFGPDPALVNDMTLLDTKRHKKLELMKNYKKNYKKSRVARTRTYNKGSVPPIAISLCYRA